MRYDNVRPVWNRLHWNYELLLECKIGVSKEYNGIMDSNWQIMFQSDFALS
jgi:hypothetical protein